MKVKDQKQLSNGKRKSSSVSALLHKSKPISVSKSEEAAALKSEKKKRLVALRLAMLEQGNDAISSMDHRIDEQVNPNPTPEPLASPKASTRKSVRKTRELYSHSESAEEPRATLSAEQGNDAISSIDRSNDDQFSPIPTPKPSPKPTRRRSVSTAKALNSGSDSSAMKRAEELRATLSAKHPILIKCMLHSQVSSGFWLGLPKKFCDEHLPTSSTMMVLVDERGERFEVKYLPAKVAFSAGWKIFSMAHNLKEGDVVVFELVKKTTFKVYIIQHDTLGEPDGTMIHHGSEACAEDDSDKDKNAASGEENDTTILKSRPVKLKGSETFEKFSILLDGSVPIDAEFPDHLRKKYYDLCKRQNSPLHKNLAKGLNRTLVVGIINETINIADAIEACGSSPNIPQSDLQAWDKTLQSFELVGMSVGFLRKRISLHTELALDSVCKEAKMERMLADERMRSLKVKFLKLSEKMEEIDAEIEEMEEEATKRN